MANRSGRNCDGEKIEHWIQTMVPEVVLAVESLDIATPERIFSHLQEQNIKATKSETEMALEYGCRVGVVEEKRRYRLDPELREVLSAGSSKPRARQQRSKMESDNGDCTSLSFSDNDMDSCSDRSSAYDKLENNDSEDFDDDDDDDDDDLDDDNEFNDRDYLDRAD